MEDLSDIPDLPELPPAEPINMENMPYVPPSYAVRFGGFEQELRYSRFSGWAKLSEGNTFLDDLGIGLIQVKKKVSIADGKTRTETVSYRVDPLELFIPIQDKKERENGVWPFKVDQKTKKITYIRHDETETTIKPIKWDLVNRGLFLALCLKSQVYRQQLPWVFSTAAEKMCREAFFTVARAMGWFGAFTGQTVKEYFEKLRKGTMRGIGLDALMHDLSEETKALLDAISFSDEKLVEDKNSDAYYIARVAVTEIDNGEIFMDGMLTTMIYIIKNGGLHDKKLDQIEYGGPLFKQLMKAIKARDAEKTRQGYWNRREKKGTVQASLVPSPLPQPSSTLVSTYVNPSMSPDEAKAILATLPPVQIEGKSNYLQFNEQDKIRWSKAQTERKKLVAKLKAIARGQANLLLSRESQRLANRYELEQKGERPSPTERKVPVEDIAEEFKIDIPENLIDPTALAEGKSMWDESLEIHVPDTKYPSAATLPRPSPPPPSPLPPPPPPPPPPPIAPGGGGPPSGPPGGPAPIPVVASEEEKRNLRKRRCDEALNLNREIKRIICSKEPAITALRSIMGCPDPVGINAPPVQKSIQHQARETGRLEGLVLTDAIRMVRR